MSFDDGVFEKRSCIAYHFGVGQFVLPYVADDVSKLLWRRFDNILLRHDVCDGLVRHVWFENCGEPQCDMCDEIPVFPFIFELAISIVVSTFVCGDAYIVACV